MKELKVLGEGVNFTAVSAGRFDSLRDYMLPLGDGVVINGKVFTGEALKSTGMEMSLQTFAPGEGSVFLHAHKHHEELYIIIRGEGEFRVDDKLVSVAEGSFSVLFGCTVSGICPPISSDGFSVSNTYMTLRYSPSFPERSSVTKRNIYEPAFSGVNAKEPFSFTSMSTGVPISDAVTLTVAHGSMTSTAAKYCIFMVSPTIISAPISLVKREGCTKSEV